MHWLLVRESKTVLDSEFQVNSGSQKLLVEIEFRIAIVSGIPDFFSCLRDSKAKKFRIPRAEISGIPVGEMHNRVTVSDNE